MRYSGNPASRLVILNDMSGPGERMPLTGPAGTEFNHILREAGFSRSDFLIINVLDDFQRDPLLLFEKKPTKNHSGLPSPALQSCIDAVHQKIAESPRDLILALGPLSFYTLTDNYAIAKWRGSQLSYRTAKLLPTYSPHIILKQWRFRYLAAWDVRRAYRWLQGECQPYEKRFTIQPSYRKAVEFATYLIEVREETRVACDIETFPGVIACVGFATSKEDAICIPFHTIEGPYWTLEEELSLVKLFRQAFRNPHIHWIFQNGNYDIQYFDRFWLSHPEISYDTMIGHHVCWPDMQKALDFQSSLYCRHHVFWKEDHKQVEHGMKSEALWRYNCEDAVRTFEISENHQDLITSLNLQGPLEFQHRQSRSLFKVMRRGIRRNNEIIPSLDSELSAHQEQQLKRISYITGRDLNPKSPQQLANFFYQDLKLPVIKSKTGSPTTDEKALKTISEKHPVLKPLIDELLLFRSIGVFRSTFLGMLPDRDGRIRTLYSVAGPKTFRYASSENAFGSGGNLQNIPDGSKKKGLPNIRKLFLPDPGYTLIDNDLARADAQCVAWEANDQVLKDLFRSGEDMHLINARDIFNNPLLTKDSRERALAKAAVHAINYGVRAPTLAKTLGITVHAADRFIKRWFLLHPQILDWHHRILDSIQTTRSVQNRFGFRMYFFDRIELCFTEALAWIPQSTVALVTDTYLLRLEESEVAQVLLQVHDSVVSQVPTAELDFRLRKMHELSQVVIPYDDPLVIPMGMKISDVSWGDCKDYDWPTPI